MPRPRTVLDKKGAPERGALLVCGNCGRGITRPLADVSVIIAGGLYSLRTRMAALSISGALA